MMMRTPLRNDWQKIECGFREQRAVRGVGGVCARCNLALVPPLIELLEAEAAAVTPPAHVLHGATAALANALAAIVKGCVEQGQQRQAARAIADQLLEHILPRLDRPALEPVLLPGLDAAAARGKEGKR